MIGIQGRQNVRTRTGLLKVSNQVDASSSPADNARNTERPESSVGSPAAGHALEVIVRAAKDPDCCLDTSELWRSSSEEEHGPATTI